MDSAKTSLDSRENVDKTRILLLVTQADWGGVQAFLIRFADELKREGFDVLLAGGGEGGLWQQARAHGIAAHQLRHLVREINLPQDWLAVTEIKRLIDEFRPMAVHLNSSKMGVLGSLAARLSATRPRVVYRIGGWAFLEPIAGWKKWIYRMSEKLTARYKDVIITVHPGDEAVAKQLNIRPRQKILTVANGLDFDYFTSKLVTRTEARAKLGLPEQAVVLGTVANAYATKGLLPYLDVLKAIFDSHSAVHAVILGDGPEFQALKDKRDALKLDRLLLAGHRADASVLYRAFDVFVLPSLKEGMPWTVLEAMAAGVPVVATDVGACGWMLQAESAHAAGLIVPPGDPVQLIAALEKITGDAGLRERLAGAGPDILKQRFTWETTYRGNRDALLKVNS